MKQLIFASVVLLVLLGGCAKEIEEYNKPAAYWYEKLIEAVSQGSLERADGYYSSLQSEHIGSPLLKEATFILAQAHMAQGEYLLSDHFLSEYIRRFATPAEREFAEYLKIEAKYLALPNPRRDQGLIDEAIESAETFKRSYPYSTFMPSVDTMLTSLVLARVSLNESIAMLYDRLDKPKAAAFYRGIAREEWIDWEEVEKANVPFYRLPFEGDGEASWYAFLIPDTQSVVSRNSLRDDENESAAPLTR